MVFYKGVKSMVKDNDIDEARIIPQHRVSPIATVSLRESFKMFPMTEERIVDSPYCITQISCNASDSVKSEPIIDDKIYGVKVHKDISVNVFELNYTIKVNDGYASNPLNNNGIKKILSDLETAEIVDAPVESLKVLIKDPKFGKLSGIDDEIFHATLISEKCDDRERKIVADYKVNELLIKKNNWQYRVLNCRELISRKEELNEDIKNYLISWRGKTGISLRSPVKIAQRLAREHFRDYRMIKTYGTGQEDRLVLLGIGR